jgi:predicted transcriptional regulator
MTKQQIAILLERAETWPQEAQDELVRSALEIERRHGGVYELDDEELADICEGLAELERGEVASDDEVKATFDALRRKHDLRRR